MGSLTNLLRWKKTLELTDNQGKPIRGADGKPKKVYLRVVGDRDLKEAYIIARAASADRRKALRDKTSLEYKTEVDIFDEASRQDCINAINMSNATSWTSQAMSIIVRPEEVNLDDVAVDPDAPTLEEQEKCDALNKEQNEAYMKEIQYYVVHQSETLEAQLKLLDDAGLKEVAKNAQENIGPLAIFMERLQVEKTWRGCFDDEKHTTHTFEGVEDYLDLDTVIKNQILSAYTQLEITGEDAKN